MDPNTLLAQLRDVHKPDPIPFWPIAPGWWLVILLVFVLIALCSYVLISTWQKNRWRRQALQKLSKLQSAYESSPSLDILLELNRLLKQSIASSRKDRRMMNLCGQEWARTLLHVKRKNTPVLDEQEIKILSETIYTHQAELIRLDAMAFKRVSLWIKQLD